MNNLVPNRINGRKWKLDETMPIEVYQHHTIPTQWTNTIPHQDVAPFRKMVDLHVKALVGSDWNKRLPLK